MSTTTTGVIEFTFRDYLYSDTAQIYKELLRHIMYEIMDTLQDGRSRVIKIGPLESRDLREYDTPVRAYRLRALCVLLHPQDAAMGEYVIASSIDRNDPRWYVHTVFDEDIARLTPVYLPQEETCASG